MVEFLREFMMVCEPKPNINIQGAARNSDTFRNRGIFNIIISMDNKFIQTSVSAIFIY